MIYIAALGCDLAEHTDAMIRGVVGSENTKQFSPSTALASGDWLVATSAYADIASLLRLNTLARATEVNLFATYLDGVDLVIGPVVRARVPGCFQCWLTRVDSARQYAKRFREYRCPGTTFNGW